MNDFTRLPSADLNRLLDLLVDNELDDARRRELLLALDAQPEGWRQCALAFLEAQTWQSAFSDASRTSPVAKPTMSIEPINLAQPEASPVMVRGSSRSFGALAIAASFLVAFSLGLLFRGTLGSNPAGVGGPTVAGDHSLQALPPGVAPGSRQVPGDQPQVVTGQPPSALSRDNVTLVVNGADGERREVDVPLVDERQLGTQVPWSARPAVPADIERQLEQLGYRVQRQQRYAPLTLEDGRRVFVPVEDAQIVPVGRRMY